MYIMDRLTSAEGQAFLAVGVTALAKAGALFYLSRRYGSSASRGHRSRGGQMTNGGLETVGRVSRLKIYPIKSANGVDVASLHCDYDGLRYKGAGDREWILADAAGKTVTLRTEGALLKLRMSVDDAGVHVDGQGMDTLLLPNNHDKAGTTVTNINSVYHHSIPGVDCGDEAAAWINKYLGRADGTYRLLSCPDWLTKSRVLDGPSKQHKQADEQDLCLFQNMCACTLLNLSSMADLAERTPVPVSEANFRANILIDGPQPFDEDEYAEVHIGDVVFRKLKDTDRCPSTTVDPETGTFNANEEPLRTLRTYRKLPGYVTPCFCISLLTRRQGDIHLGDQVKVVRK